MINKYINEGFIHGETLKNCFNSEAYYTGRDIINKVDSLLSGNTILVAPDPVFEPPLMPDDFAYAVTYLDKFIEDGEAKGGYWDVIGIKVKQITFNAFGKWIVTYDADLYSDTNDFGEVVFRTYDEAFRKAATLNKSQECF